MRYFFSVLMEQSKEIFRKLKCCLSFKSFGNIFFEYKLYIDFGYQGLNFHL